MAYDESTADRIRNFLTRSSEIVEKKMFGGTAFMLRGNMCCGVIDKKMMLRVGPEQYEKALSRPYARKMDFTGRPMKGFVYVEPAGFASEKHLKEWIRMATDYVLSLPVK